MPGALEGLRIVDLTTGLAGPLATMMLGDHGADVVKVEPPGGDPQRSYVGSVVTNRGKRSVVLDLDSPADRDRLLELVDTADVLVESFAPGHLAARGLDYATVSPGRPSLVYCSLTGYPRTTDAADRPAIDLLVQARSGMQYEQPGFREGPIFLHAPLPSIAASYLTVEGILAALYVREVTGRGQWVETSLYQGVLAFTTQLWQDAEHRVEPWFEIGFEPRPSIYECADGLWVHSMHFAGGRGKDRSIVWEILGIDAPDLEWSPTGAQAFDDVVRDAIGRMKRQDLLDQFWANEIAIAPVRHAHEALEDEQVVNNGMSVEVDDPRLGPVRQAGICFRLHAAPTPAVQGPQPALGQHTDEVLGALADEPARARAARPAKRPVSHTLEGIKILDLGNFLAGPFGPMLLGDLGATVYKLESPQGDQMRPVTQPFNGCRARQARRRRRPQATRGTRDRAPAHPRGRRRAPQHAAGRRRAARRRLRDRQAAQPDGDLLPHDDVGQRRPTRDLARLRPARAVVVRARAGAGRRGQRSQLVPLRHVRPGVRGAVGARGADGALLARAHRRGSAGRHVDRERRRAPEHRRVDRARRRWSERPRTDQQQTGSRSALPALPDERRLARAGLPRARPTGPRSRRRCPTSTTRASAIRPGARQRRRARRGAGPVPRVAHRPRRLRPARRGRGAGRDRAGGRPAHVVRPTGPRRRRARRRLRAPDLRALPPVRPPRATSRRRPAPSAGRRRCSASTRGRCSSDLGYPAEEIDQLRERGVTVWPD